MRGSERGLFRALAAIGLAAFLAAANVSCETLHSTDTMATRTQLARAEDHALQRNYPMALALFIEVAQSTPDPVLRAQACLGAGRVQTTLGDYRQALDDLHRARGAGAYGALDTAITQALGEVYFARRDYALAYQNLRGLEHKVGASAQPRLLLELGIAAYRTQRLDEAHRCLAASRYATDVELARLFAEHVPDYVPPSVAARPARPAPRASIETDREPEAGPVRVLSRNQWSAAPIRSNREAMGRVYRVTVHHTGNMEPNGHSFEDAAAAIRGIQQVHQKEKGWADIGYHYIIDRSGRVWQGRDSRFQGAHASGSANEGNVGIVLMGDFTHQRVTPSQASALARFLDEIVDKYRVPSSRIYTHAEIRDGHTDCPGAEITRLVHKYRRDGLARAP